MPTELILCGPATPLLANVEYALPASPHYILAQSALTTATTLGGSYTTLTGATTEPGAFNTGGGFVKSASNTVVVAKKATKKAGSAGGGGPILTFGKVQSTPTATHSTLAACVFPVPPTIGSGIVVGALFSGVPTTTCTDNKGNTYTVASYTVGSISSELVAIYYCPKITATGSSFTVTVGSSGVSAAIVAVAIEVGGVGAGLAVEITGGGAGISATPNTLTSTVTAPAGKLGFAVGAISITQSSLNVSTIDSLLPNVWTQEAEQLVQSPWEAGEINSRFLTGGTGAIGVTWTGSASGWWAATCAVLKPT